MLLHIRPIVGKNACQNGALTDCRNAVITGSLHTPSYVYLLVAKGDLPDVGGFDCGILYDNGNPAGRSNHQGVDIFSWTLCGSLEFPSPGARVWPDPGAGNLITWNTTSVCQTGETAVAGYFYVSAYSNDVMQVTRRPASGDAVVSTCAAIDHTLTDADLGWVQFSSGGGGGCNPCVDDCTPNGTPLCLVSNRNLDFGNVTVNMAKDLSLTVTNGGTGRMIGHPVASGGEFTVMSPDYDLQVGQSVTVTVRFVPRSAGMQTGTLDLGSCGIVALSGAGYEPISVQLYPQSQLYFPDVPVGTSSTGYVNIENRGNGAITGIFSFSGNQLSCHDFSLIGASTFPLAPGESITLPVRFAPTVTGTVNCFVTMVFSTSQNVSISKSYELTGVGLPPNGCRFNPDAADFGVVLVGQYRDRMFQLSNIGDHAITGIVNAYSTDYPGDYFVVGDPTYDLSPGGSQYFTVRFQPSSDRSERGTLEGGCFNFVSLVGQGEILSGSSCSLSTTSLNFGHVAVGDSAYLPFRIFNAEAAVHEGRVTESCPDFYVAYPDTFHLGLNEADTMLVVFKPTVTNTQSCSFVVPGCGTVMAVGNNVAMPPVSPEQLNFGYVAVGDSASLPFGLTNVTPNLLAGTVTEDCPDFQVESPSYALAPGETKYFVVKFVPSVVSNQMCTIHPTPDLILPCLANVPVNTIPTTWSAIKTRFTTPTQR